MFIPSTFKRPVSSWKALNLRKTLLMASSVRLKPLNCSRLPCVYAQETLTFLLRSSYFATFRHQLTILSKTDALDEEKWLNMLGTFVKDWFIYESHFVHGRDSLVDILKERGLLSESDAVQPLIGKKSRVKLLNNPYVSRPLWPLLSSFRLLPFWI